MPSLDDVELRVLEMSRRRGRQIVERPLPGSTPHRESVSGLGLRWEIRGILQGSSKQDLSAKEDALKNMLDGQTHTFKEYDDPGAESYSVVVADLKLERLPGPLFRSEYTLVLLSISS